MILMESVRWKNGHCEGPLPCGPEKLTMTRALVKLLTYALAPETSTLTGYGKNQLTIRSPHGVDVDIVTFDTDSDLEAHLLFRAANFWVLLQGRECTFPLNKDLKTPSNWDQYATNCGSLNDATAKWLLFMMLSSFNNEEMIEYAQYDINDIADALDILGKSILNGTSIVTFQSLIPAMVRARPLR